jgi:hypothetical protein
MGPGFESQRDHNLRRQIAQKALQINLCRAFCFWRIVKTTKLLQIGVRNSSEKIKKQIFRSNYSETRYQQGIRNLNMPFNVTVNGNFINV